MVFAWLHMVSALFYYATVKVIAIKADKPFTLWSPFYLTMYSTFAKLSARDDVWIKKSGT